jgi:hypothetical protein
MIWRVTLTDRDESISCYDFDRKHEAIGWLVEKIVHQNYAKYAIEFIVKPPA